MRQNFLPHERKLCKRGFGRTVAEVLPTADLRPSKTPYIRASTYVSAVSGKSRHMSSRMCLWYDSSVMTRKEKPFDRELFFRALADSTRLRIINLIGDQEVCVCFFVEILKTNQPKISRHLAYLRRAGIVAARREGIWMHYRIATPKDENAANVLMSVREWLANDPTMQQDRKRLDKICCAPELPIQLQGSPKPLSIALP